MNWVQHTVHCASSGIPAAKAGCDAEAKNNAVKTRAEKTRGILKVHMEAPIKRPQYSRNQQAPTRRIGSQIANLKSDLKSEMSHPARSLMIDDLDDLRDRPVQRIVD